MDTQLIDSPPRQDGEWVCGWLPLPALPLGTVPLWSALCRTSTASWSEREGRPQQQRVSPTRDEVLKSAKMKAFPWFRLDITNQCLWRTTDAGPYERAFSYYAFRRPISRQHMRCFLE